MMIKYFLFFLILFFFSISKAEDSFLTLKQQIDRLQREVNDLSKSVFKSSRDKNFIEEEKLNNTNNLTVFDLRIYDLEKDIKKLNSNFEELIFQIDDLNTLYNKLNQNFSDLLLSDKKNINENKIKTISIEKENNEIIEENILGTLKISSQDLSVKVGKEKEKKAVIQTDDLIVESIQLSSEEEFQKAFDMLRSQQFDAAKKSLKIFIKNHSDDKLSGSAHYWLGEIYLLKKEYREAALILAEGFQKFPKSIKAPDMLYKLSDSLIAINKKNDACSTLKKITQEFPKNKLVDKAKNKIVALDCPNLAG